MHCKECSLLEVVWSTIKFLVFYIALYVFVNMIFIHVCFFMASWLGAVFLGFVSLICEFIDLQGFNRHAGS